MQKLKTTNLKTVRIKIRNEMSERELFSAINHALFSCNLEPEFMEVSGREHTVMSD